MLEITYNNQDIKLDRFFESLVYRYIIDAEFTVNERSILLFITRKTIGWDKLSDNIGFKEFTWSLNLSDKTIRKTINDLVDNKFIIKEASKGGKSINRDRYSNYKIGNKILSHLIDEWIDIKELNGFIV